ncbi:hypothetical protein [Atopomonas hussainii]|uniref:hypothetical protein n=1 Tax=Atopomonas hussainii TaxID=1429083 RepID=UPI0011139BA8|nr:hypothetical protein [Atopomonas hussainii]
MARRKDSGLMLLAGTLIVLGIGVLIKAESGSGSTIIASKLMNTSAASPEFSTFSAIVIISVGAFILYKA